MTSRTSFIRCLGLSSGFGAVAALSVFSGFGITPSARAQALNIYPYSQTVTADLADNNAVDIMECPRVLSFETVDGSGNQFRKILVSWQHTTSDQVNRHQISSDNGTTWGSVVTTAPSGLDFYAAVRRRDGTLLAVPFNLASKIGNPPPTGPVTSFATKYYTSTDNGSSWTEHTDGIFNFAEQVYWMRVHRGMFESDGKLYVAGYAPYPSDWATHGVSPRAVLFESTDNGVTWTQKARLTPAGGGAEEAAQPPPLGPPTGYNEVTVERCANGDWLAVVREGHKWQYPLKYTRSTDKGATWSTLAYLPGLGSSNPNRSVYDSDQLNETADPVLKLMPNGVMVLSYGRPHTKVAFSADGNGTSWTNITHTYVETPNALNILGKESYCYTSVAPIASQTLLVFGDTGAHWSYDTTGNPRPHPIPNPYSIWQKQVEIIRPQVNRIDLKTKLKQGVIGVATDMTHSHPSFPETRVAGAVDGSTDYWSGAFKNATSGSYTIDLRRTYTLNALGLCLHYDVAQGATVEFSTDGSTWTTLQTFPSTTTHYAMQYLAFADTQARYVRVNVSRASAPVSLNEIELYSTADTFENWAPNVTLASHTGYTLSDRGFWVTDALAPATTGYQSTRALYMEDTNANDQTASKTFTAATVKTLEFWLKPVAYSPSNGAIEWCFTSGTTRAFRLRVDSTHQIQYYNGAYHNVGANAPLNTWTKIKVVADATTDTATLFVNDVQIGAAHSIGCETPVASFDGFVLGSGGAAAVGDKAYFDDIELYTAANTIAITTQPLSQVVAPGSSLTLTVTASGVAPISYQWFKEGVAIVGATSATHNVAAVTTDVAGTYTVLVSNAEGSLMSVPATVVVGTPVSGRLANLSVRALAGADAQTLIVGFIIGGGSKQVLLRGLGPTLSLPPFNVTGTLADPKLQIFGSSSSLPSNENWSDGNASATLSAVFNAAGAHPLDPASKDAALHSTLAGGGYTAWITGAPGTSGIALAEIFDTEGANAAGRLANISARAQVGTGDNILIVGFIISGNTPKQVLIRALGPTLAGAPHNVPGVLADPKLDLYPAGATTPSVSNDNWSDNGGGGALSAAFTLTGAGGLSDSASKDAAMLVTLQPGAYTALVSGVTGTTGVALVELFEMP